MTEREYLSQYVGQLDASRGVVAVLRRMAEVVGALDSDDVAALSSLISRAAELGRDVRALEVRFAQGLPAEPDAAASEGTS